MEHGKGGEWPMRESNLKEPLLTMIRQRLEEHPSTTASDLVRDLANLGVYVSRQLVSLAIRTQLNYTWKRIRKRGPKGSSWSEEQLGTFKTKFKRSFLAGTLSSWDESSFDQRAHSVYGYARKGFRAILNVPKTKCKHRHYSLLMGLHMNGEKHYGVFEGSVKCATFADFMKQSPFPPGTVILLDNHSMHKTKEVKAVAFSKGFELLYTPPYSPEFNPIELCFGIVKH